VLHRTARKKPDAYGDIQTAPATGDLFGPDSGSQPQRLTEKIFLPRRAPRGALKRGAIIILLACSTSSIQAPMTRKNRRKPPGPAVPKRSPDAGSHRTYGTVHQCSSSGWELNCSCPFHWAKNMLRGIHSGTLMLPWARLRNRGITCTPQKNHAVPGRTVTIPGREKSNSGMNRSMPPFRTCSPRCH
jgi:hypothetical protein